MVGDSYNDNLHYGADRKLYEYGRAMRKASTVEEDILWQSLRNRKLLGLKFRRQHPLYKYVVDFYCHEAKLAIEIDKDMQDGARRSGMNELMTAELNELGIKVIRFSNEEIAVRLPDVLKSIENIVLSVNPDLVKGDS